MRGRKKASVLFLLFLVGLLWLYGCGSPSPDSEVMADIEEESDLDSGEELVYERSLELQYAENFKVDYYEGGYTLLTITMDGTQFLIVPENGDVPQTLDKEIVVLRRPIKDIYLVASSAMDIFSELDGLNSITFSGQKEDGWFIEAAREEMQRVISFMRVNTASRIMNCLFQIIVRLP